MLNRFRILLFALILVPFFADAQSFYAIRRNRNLLVNAGSGIAYYKGDLVNPREFGKVKPNIVIGAEYYFLPRISARASLTWFVLAGDDSKANDDRVERNLHFRSSCWEFAATGAVNLIPMGTRFYQRPRINLHAWAGIGVMAFNPKAEYNGKWEALAPLNTENVNYKRIQPVIPFGLGVRIKVDPFFNILIEGGYRKTFTDYLDDVSNARYTPAPELGSDLARALADRRIEGFLARGEDFDITKYSDPEWASTRGRRGNPDDKDGYFIGNITVQYYFPQEILGSQRKLYNRKRKAIYRKR